MIKFKVAEKRIGKRIGKGDLYLLATGRDARMFDRGAKLLGLTHEELLRRTVANAMARARRNA